MLKLRCPQCNSNMPQMAGIDKTDVNADWAETIEEFMEYYRVYDHVDRIRLKNGWYAVRNHTVPHRSGRAEYVNADVRWVDGRVRPDGRGGERSIRRDGDCRWSREPGHWVVTIRE